MRTLRRAGGGSMRCETHAYREADEGAVLLAESVVLEGEKKKHARKSMRTVRRMGPSCLLSPS